MAIKHLYIIGNGFDLYHGIKSKYRDFLNWLQGEKGFDPSLAECLESAYAPFQNILWSEFESYLPNIQKAAIKHDAVAKPSVLFVDEGLKESQIVYAAIKKLLRSTIGSFANQSPVVREIGLDWEKIHERLDNAFHEWVTSLNYDANSISPCLTFPTENAHFISFNYTNTLEQIYGVPRKQITYIHGNASENPNLIFGHNKEFFALEKSSIMKEISDDGEYNGEKVVSLLKTLKKDVAQVITTHPDLFDYASQASIVHIWGTSLGQVDLPCFIKFAQHMNLDAITEVNWHIEKGGKSDFQINLETHQEITKVLHRLHFLGFSNIKTIDLQSYQRSKS